MAFGFNLFMPFREYGASALEEPLGRSVGFAVRVIGIGFEFHGPTDVLGECAGPLPTEDEKFTASDVVVQVEDDAGRAGLILVEVKLSEGGFTLCGGAKSKANRRKDVCASSARFFADPRACYLRRTRHARRDRRYWKIFDAAFGSVRAMVPRYSGERCLRIPAQSGLSTLRFTGNSLRCSVSPRPKESQKHDFYQCVKRTSRLPLTPQKTPGKRASSPRGRNGVASVPRAGSPRSQDPPGTVAVHFDRAGRLGPGSFAGRRPPSGARGKLV